jgi:flagellar hook-length control protein FliK
MSANLLNTAALPSAVPGAGAGIAAQAAQAAQGHGPLAGFEAMLAAFFGDQGLVAPAVGPAVVAGQPVVAGAGAAAGKTAGKTASAADKPGKDVAATADGAKTAAAADAAASGVDAALALIVPPAPSAPQTAAVGGTPSDSTPPEAGSDGKAPGSAAIAALTAAIDAKTAKDPDSHAVIALTNALDAKTAKIADTQGDNASANAQLPAQANGKPPAAPPPPEALAANSVGPQAIETANAPVAVAAAAPTATNAGKDKVQPAKGVRVEGARTETAPVAVAGKSAIAVPAFAEAAGKDASSDGRDPNAPATETPKAAAVDTAQGGGEFNPATNSTIANSAAALAHAAVVRGSPQTVANLAAQIAKKLDGRSSRFDVQLDPAGLGKVDVRVEIDAAGKMTAAMHFDNQQAANELKSRAGELQRALEQAGFDMSGGLSFDVGQGGQGRSQGQDADAAPVFRGRAFQAVLDGGADASALTQSSFSRASKSGVDIRI